MKYVRLFTNVIGDGRKMFGTKILLHIQLEDYRYPWPGYYNSAVVQNYTHKFENSIDEYKAYISLIPLDDRGKRISLTVK